VEEGEFEGKESFFNHGTAPPVSPQSTGETGNRPHTLGFPDLRFLLTVSKGFE